MAWLVVLGDKVVLTERLLVTVALGFARSTGELLNRVLGAPRSPEAENASKRQKDHSYFF